MTLPRFAYSYGEIDFDVNQMVLRAGAQKDNAATNFISVGRTWVTSANQYQGLIASYNKSSGGQDTNFNINSATPGKILLDFGGAAGDNLCNAVVYAYDGFIAACRSMTPNGFYDIYLVKFDASGNLDTGFGTNGIKKTSLGGDSTNGHALIRGAIYDSVTGNAGNHGTIVITGAIGKYSPGVFHPFIAAFDQDTGAQYGTTTSISGINGTAVAIAFDSANSKYYTASTETTANHGFYIHQFNTSLAAAGAPWGTAVNFTTAISGGAADSIPSGIAVIGTNVITTGSNRKDTSSPWRCAVTAHSTATGNLNTSFGSVPSPLTGGTANQGITLFTANVSNACILNAVSTPPTGTTINAVGTIFNGSNYDYLASQMNISGTMAATFGTNGIQTQGGGLADDVLNYGLYLNGSATDYYGVGRAQSTTLVNGGALSKIGTTSGSFTTVTVNSWSKTTTVGAPSSRTLFTSQWTGSLLLIWGGSTNTGGKYDPVANSWSNMATAGAPSARSESISSWTGTKMAVWGGGNYLNTGALYDPAANNWTTMATLGAPAGRISADANNPWAPWVGTGIAFWGKELKSGSSSTSLGNNGGIYNPTTNSWTAISTLAAPSGRDNFEFAWTGTKLIVFGGYTNNGNNSPTLVNTGGSYTPLTNTWTALPTLSAPSPRFYAASAWATSNWIIWGGATNTSFSTSVNTGAIYNPLLNTWSPLTTLGAPSPRSIVRGGWTGSKFIVWSGYDGDVVNTGGIYNYAAATWSAMATLNAPSERYSTHAFWTGSKFLIWGMYGNSNTGGAYTP